MGNTTTFAPISGYPNLGESSFRWLRLTSVTFPDNTTCSLAYNNENDLIPSTLSRGVDHWGYMNGASGATHLIGNGLCQNVTTSSFTEANRTPTIGWAQYCSLKKVSYSTGLDLSLDYESHFVRNSSMPAGSGTPGEVGGIRVNRITTQDQVSNLHTIREYNYNQPGTTITSGFLTLAPTYRFDIRGLNEELYSAAQRADTTRKSRNDSLKAALPAFVYNSYLYGQALARSGKPYVGYRHVEETLYSGQIDLNQFNHDLAYKESFRLGKSQYEFDQEETDYDPCDNTNGFSYYPWRYRPNFDYRAGSLLKLTEYGRANQLRGERVLTYNFEIGFNNDPNKQYGITVGYVVLRYNNQVSDSYSSSYYSNYFRRYGLTADRIRLYDQNGTDFTESTTTYRYKDQMHLYESDYFTRYPGQHTQLCLVQTTDARGRLTDMITTYAGDFDFGTTPTYEPYPCYDETTGNSIPDCYTVYSEPETIPTDDAARAIYDMRRKNMKAAVVESYTKRNGQFLMANYQTYKKDGADNNTAQAGEPFQSYRLDNYPLASFSPLTPGQFIKDNNYILAATVNAYNAIGMPTSMSANFQPETRMTYGTNNLLPASRVVAPGLSETQTTTYEYAVPMFGISKQTGANGQHTSYEFEPATGRLQLIKDSNGAVIRRYEYKRKNQ